MSKRFFAALLGAGALAVGALTAGVSGADAAAPHLTHLSGLHAQRVCAKTPAAGHATCYARVLVNRKGAIPMATAPLASALSPIQLRSAYNLNGTSGGGRTVAIVDAYGYTNLQRDLGIYRAQYGLPACTTANGCLRVVNQTGGTSLPRNNVGWSQEQALDLDAVSAACPDCKIVMVQAKSGELRRPRYGRERGREGDIRQRRDLQQLRRRRRGGLDVRRLLQPPGHRGDRLDRRQRLPGRLLPRVSSYVTAVGGTSLTMSGTTRVSETVWSGAGSGCSTLNAALPAAASFNTGCAKRAMADVSAAADPNTGGLSVYAPTTARNSSWSQYGGTSESAPIIASVYALAGGGYSNATPYAHPGNLFDVTSGSNGTCPTTQWCHARAGWDGPTGLGTPNGTGAF